MAMTNAATARIVRINHDDAAMWAIDRTRNKLTVAIVIRPIMRASVVPCSRACRLDRLTCAVPAIGRNVGRFLPYCVPCSFVNTRAAQP